MAVGGEQARERITAALAAGDGPSVPFEVLHAALRWAAETLRRADGTDGGAAALAAVFALDDALDAVPGLAAAVPALLTAAGPGADVHAYLTERTRTLSLLTERLAEDRAALDELRAREWEIADRLAEHAPLLARVDELRRLERLVAALDLLREQQQVIDARLKVLREYDSGADDTLRTASTELLRLSREQLALLTARTREALDEADLAHRSLAGQETRLAAVTAELAEVTDRLAAVRAELGSALTELRLHSAADRDLARALSRFTGPEPAAAGEHTRIEDARAITETIAERLTEAEDILRHVMTDRRARSTDGRHVIHRTAP